jgi:elongation factor Ts
MIIENYLDKIKELRTLTGSSITECKNALNKTNGNINEALTLLKSFEILNANKKLNRNTFEGIIFSYIHPNSKIGVLLELNCETDFVAKRTEFKELAKTITLQIASTLNPLYNLLSEIPESLKKKEVEINSNLSSKEVEKLLEKYLLLKQPLILNEKILVEDYIKSYISLLGENIKINRFIKYSLNEYNIN